MVDELVGTSSGTFEVLLKWNGAVNIEEFDEETFISIRIGDFQFADTLGGAENYVAGQRSARFREKGSDNKEKEVEVRSLEISWNTKTFAISGTVRNFTDGYSSDDNYIAALNYLDLPGPVNDAHSHDANIVFGAYDETHPLVVTGKNTVTRKVVRDEDFEDEFFENKIDLSGAAADLPPNDSTKPTVSITSPNSNGKIFEPLMTGKASDNKGVAEVLYRVGVGDFVLAQGSTNWSADFALEAEEGGIMLVPGSNTVEVKSVDFSGNESTVLKRTFIYAVLEPLMLDVSEGGTTTLTNLQPLELGASYSITAKPAPGYLFQGWNGIFTADSTNPTLKFTMESGLFLQANFVPNQFIPVTGIYNGIFSNTAGEVHPTNAGFFTLTLRDSGVFSGTILLDGARAPISGLLDPTDGRVNKTILRRGKPPLDVSLELDFEAVKLTGTITQGDGTSDLEAELAQSTTNSSKTNYTLLIPPGSDPITEPGGYGSGCASIDLKGKLKFKGVLGEGTAASQATMVSKSGRWPLFVSLYKGKGVLLGWMTFSDEPDNDVSGNVTWVKVPGATGKLYTSGFSLSGAMIASTHVAPPSGTPVLEWTNGSVEFSGGNLVTPLTNEIAIGIKNKVTVVTTNKTTLSITAKSGLLKGKLANPDTKKSAAIKGVLLQKQQLGAGLFLGTNQSGYLIMQIEADPL